MRLVGESAVLVRAVTANPGILDRELWLKPRKRGRKFPLLSNANNFLERRNHPAILHVLRFIQVKATCCNKARCVILVWIILMVVQQVGSTRTVG